MSGLITRQMSEAADGLDFMAWQIHQTARDKGFWDHEVIRAAPHSLNEEGAVMGANPSFFEEKLMLIVSEVAEVLEARRDKDDLEEEEECADILIRVLDYMAGRGFNPGKAVVEKMQRNADRPHLHGRAR